jgi:hypothetical protein
MAGGGTDRLPIEGGKSLPASTLWRRLLSRAEPPESDPPPVPAQKLVVNNAGTEPLEIMIEVYPDRYVLRPGSKMVIEADLEGEPIDITPYPNGLQIYAGNDSDPIVSIDGKTVGPDWNTPTPNSK